MFGSKVTVEGVQALTKSKKIPHCAALKGGAETVLAVGPVLTTCKDHIPQVAVPPCPRGT